MANLSLTERFRLAKEEITPAQALVNELVRVTHRRESTVRQWLYGKKKPDPIIQDVLASYFETDAEILFPNS